MPRPLDGYLEWVSSGDSDKIARPPDAKLAVGWGKGEPFPYQWLNYLFYLLDQWVQYLDQTQGMSAAAATAFNNMRLIGGGNWSVDLSTNSMTWSDTFYLPVPGVPDYRNACTNGTIYLADGQIAYVNANIPIATTGNINGGSKVITNLASTLGIVPGMAVSGFGISPLTIVQSVDDEQTVTINRYANFEAINSPLFFIGTDPLQMTQADQAAFVPQPNSVIIARRVGNRFFVGANAHMMAISDGESKTLLSDGYTHLTSATFGQNIAQGQAVYISDGSDGRTVGSAYLCDASATNGATRSNFVGFAITPTSSGQVGAIVCGGSVSDFFTGLNQGARYYIDPANPGGITSTRPTVAGQYVVPVGLAELPTSLLMGAIGQAAVVSNLAPWPQYSAASEAQWVSALANVATTGGGVIVIASPFTVTSQYTIPDNTIIIGRGASCGITVAANAGVTFGSFSRMQDVYLANLDGSFNAGSLVSINGNDCSMQDCTFGVTNAGATAVTFNGAQCISYRCIFTGVLGPSGGTGIKYAGVENKDVDSTFTY